ncbi:colicin immunity domain-containing protein [Mycolicibacterium stellerae]|uniref:colicin immunity domain-containing protein n=1 Tax=Mycolicibacterium stellerae TaxID=2358193 RepID=UPI0013DE3CAE|nr:colicin immunity domain-containing protein [Mycolicibacterium stellerae]
MTTREFYLRAVHFDENVVYDAFAVNVQILGDTGAMAGGVVLEGGRETSMSKRPNERPDLRVYVGLIDNFITNVISAPEFQKSYLSTMKSEQRVFGAPIFPVIQRLFGDADTYVAYPELRTEPADLDDEQLRECAIRARRELRELGFD